ncbi:UNVERIFIED_CONTAM: hypothetical protein NY603_29575, partial [Bacteroidetes bacterium 56_B9]
PLSSTHHYHTDPMGRMSRHGWNPNKPFTQDEQLKAVIDHGDKIVYSARYSSAYSPFFGAITRTQSPGKAAPAMP